MGEGSFWHHALDETAACFLRGRGTQTGRDEISGLLLVGRGSYKPER